MKKLLIFWVLAVGFTFSRSNTADSLFQAGNWKAAIAAYEAYHTSSPADRPAFQWNRIGQCYFQLQDWPNAISAYAKSIQFNSTNASVMYNLACAYARNAQRDSALTWLDRSADAGFTQYQNMPADEDLLGIRDDLRFPDIVQKVKKNAEPCAFQPEAQQFDFWIGHWKVYNPQGQRAGTSDIEQILGECVIQENWTDYFGNKGKSFNFYNSPERSWQQTWVDDKGSVTEFIDGKYEDGVMRFRSSRPVSFNGKTIIRRLAFFQVSATEVRQLGERSEDNGQSWLIEYDFRYIRE